MSKRAWGMLTAAHVLAAVLYVGAGVAKAEGVWCFYNCPQGFFAACSCDGEFCGCGCWEGIQGGCSCWCASGCASGEDCPII